MNLSGINTYIHAYDTKITREHVYFCWQKIRTGVTRNAQVGEMTNHSVVNNSRNEPELFNIAFNRGYVWHWENRRDYLVFCSQLHACRYYLLIVVACTCVCAYAWTGVCVSSQPMHAPFDM